MNLRWDEENEEKFREDKEAMMRWRSRRQLILHERDILWCDKEWSDCLFL